MENQDSNQGEEQKQNQNQNQDQDTSNEPELIRTLRESANQPIGPETIHIRRVGSGPPPTPPSSEAIPDPISAETARSRASYVRTMITKIERYLKDGKTKEEIDTLPHIPEFKKKFSKLYDTVMTPGYDKQSLYTMLLLLEKMGRSEMSQHDASVIVGQRLFDKYVQTRLD